MKYELILTGKFKKGLKLARKRGLDIDRLEDVVTKLQNDIALETKYRDHDLTGNWKGKQLSHAGRRYAGAEPEKKMLSLKDHQGLLRSKEYRRSYSFGRGDCTCPVKA